VSDSASTSAACSSSVAAVRVPFTNASAGAAASPAYVKAEQSSIAANCQKATFQHTQPAGVTAAAAKPKAAARNKVAPAPKLTAGQKSAARRERRREREEQARALEQEQVRQQVSQQVAKATAGAFPSEAAPAAERQVYTQHLLEKMRESPYHSDALSRSFLHMALDDPLTSLPRLQLDAVVRGNPDETLLMKAIRMGSKLHVNTQQHLLRSVQRDGYDVRIRASAYSIESSGRDMFYYPGAETPSYRSKTYISASYVPTNIFFYVLRYTTGTIRQSWFEVLLSQPSFEASLLNERGWEQPGFGQPGQLLLADSACFSSGSAEQHVQWLTLLAQHGADMSRLPLNGPTNQILDLATLRAHTHWFLHLLDTQQRELLSTYFSSTRPAQASASKAGFFIASPQQLQADLHQCVFAWADARREQLSLDDSESTLDVNDLVLQRQLQQLLAQWDARTRTYCLQHKLSLTTLLNTVLQYPADIDIQQLLHTLFKCAHDQLNDVSATSASAVALLALLRSAPLHTTPVLQLLVGTSHNMWSAISSICLPARGSLLFELYKLLLSRPLPPDEPEEPEAPADAAHRAAVRHLWTRFVQNVRPEYRAGGHISPALDGMACMLQLLCRAPCDAQLRQEGLEKLLREILQKVRYCGFGEQSRALREAWLSWWCSRSADFPMDFRWLHLLHVHMEKPATPEQLCTYEGDEATAARWYVELYRGALSAAEEWQAHIQRRVEECTPLYPAVSSIVMSYLQ
jgi:hypothetical protein